jgi:rubrerythrin
VASDQPSFALGSLRVDQDTTLQNLLHALTLNYELSARYRAFQFEAEHERVEDCAALFPRLREQQGEHIADLLRALGRRLPESADAVARREAK